MKRLFGSLMALLIAATAFSQPDTTVIEAEGPVKVIEEPERTTVKVGDDSVVVVEEGKDTTKIKFGKKGITIIEGPDGTEIDMEDLGENEDKEEKNTRKFKPHWAGFEWGINNYVNSDMSMNLSPQAEFMDLRTSRSWNFNLNLFDYGFGFGTDKLGLVTGLGLEWNNYHFTGSNNITVDENDMVVEFEPQFSADVNYSVEKTKLLTTYLTAPLLLEGQIPAGKKRVYIAAGVIGGVKLGAKTKIVYEVEGSKQKDKIRDDFNLNLLRYGFTARAGYRALNIYATWYPTPLFMEGEGPELYPFSVGLTLVHF